MTKIEPNELYSLRDLEELLGDMLSVDAFLKTIDPKRPFKKCFWGGHLIEALDRCDKDVRGNLHRDFGRISQSAKKKKKSQTWAAGVKEPKPDTGFTPDELGIGYGRKG